MNIIEKSESIQTGLRKGFQDGTSKLAQCRCYGYDTSPDGELVVNPDEAAVVRWIFDRYLNGDSLGKIATGLEEQGIPSPTGKPKWNRETINKLLSNEKYTGRVLLQKTINAGSSKFKNDGLMPRYLYDYKFERVWKRPDQDVEKLTCYHAILSPDFSMYLELSPVMQLYNVFRNRWCGAYFSSKGIRVVPTVSWGEESTFDFCFAGIPQGSTVAVSTYMVSAHGNHADQKEFFLKGYQEMLRRIEPERIICYNKPLSQMEGNIVFIDYELSSWKYQNENDTPSKYLAYILGEQPLPADGKIHIKSGYVLRENKKGMGSAYGGPWKPAKPADERVSLGNLGR